MVSRSSAAQFRLDPLRFLDQALQAAEKAIWLPGGALCVAEPSSAREVLANGHGLYAEHSDFFHTRRGQFGRRAVQTEMGRAARALLRSYVAARADRLAEQVSRAMVPTSEWPDTGNWLVYEHLAAALVSPGSPAGLHRTVHEIVERSVLAGARQRHTGPARVLYRRRVLRELRMAVEHRRSRGAAAPGDMLDVVVGAAGSDVPPAELAEIFASFVFAVAGSVGFALGWSLYLLGTNPQLATEPAWIVREALRLWPVAWMLGRRPVRPHEVAGVLVTPQDQVIVCPYLVHRSARHWEAPLSFRPERWATVSDHEAFIPFGWGPHRCVAAALAMELIEHVLRIIVDGYRVTLRSHDARPHAGPALAPPRFTLGLAARPRPAVATA